MTIPKEVQEDMREIILNWDKLNDDTRYSIIGLTEFLRIEKGIELYTGLTAMQVLDDDSQGILDKIGLGMLPSKFIDEIKEIAES